MKLFYISYARLPTERAYGIQIMNMCSAFKSKGINLELIIPSKKNSKEINLFKYYRIKNKFKIKKLRILDLFHLELTLPSFLWLPFYYIMVFEFYLHSFFYLLFYKDKKEEFICYYTRDYLNLLFLWLIKCIKKRGKLFLELHKIPSSCVFLFYKFLRFADGIIVLNNILKEILLKKEKNLKILIAQDAVDTSLFKEKDKTYTRKKLNIPLDKNVISYAGSLYPYKGIYTLIDSLEYLPKDCILYIVGGPTYYINLLKEYLRQRPTLAENIKLVGYIPQEEVVDYLCSSDVLVLPNTTKDVISFLYTSPLKLFEYASVKRPIVATDTPSIREILTEDDAILVKPDDPYFLAEGIEKILKDKDKAEKISHNLYNKLKNYTWDNRAESIINFIRKCL